MRRVCIFCGSNSGTRPEYRFAAQIIGRQIAEAGLGMVYGGAHVGLMGVAADAALAAGGEVIGVIPKSLEGRELAHQGLTALHIVNSMHERKAKMVEESDAFVALPGGYGTLDEFFEAVTWAVLGIHSKPCLLVNIDGYYDPLIAFLGRAAQDGFVNGRGQELIELVDNASEVVPLVQRLWLREGSEVFDREQVPRP